MEEEQGETYGNVRVHYVPNPMRITTDGDLQAKVPLTSQQDLFSRWDEDRLQYNAAKRALKAHPCDLTNHDIFYYPPSAMLKLPYLDELKKETRSINLALGSGTVQRRRSRMRPHPMTGQTHYHDTGKFVRYTDTFPDTLFPKGWTCYYIFDNDMSFDYLRRTPRELGKLYFSELWWDHTNMRPCLCKGCNQKQ